MRDREIQLKKANERWHSGQDDQDREGDLVENLMPAFAQSHAQELGNEDSRTQKHFLRKGRRQDN